MGKNDDEARWNAVLSGVARNVAAVPAVLTFVTLGAAVLTAQSLVDVAGKAWRRRVAPPAHTRAPQRRRRRPSRAARVAP